MRFLICGAGTMGHEYALEHLTQENSGAYVTAICDTDLYRAKQLAKKVQQISMTQQQQVQNQSQNQMTSEVQVYSSIEEAINSDSQYQSRTQTSLKSQSKSTNLSSIFDAVYIATPPTYHAHCFKAAVRAGKHALLEKPLAGPSADYEQVGLEQKQEQQKMQDLDGPMSESFDHEQQFNSAEERIAARPDVFQKKIDHSTIIPGDSEDILEIMRNEVLIRRQKNETPNPNRVIVGINLGMRYNPALHACRDHLCTLINDNSDFGGLESAQLILKFQKWPRGWQNENWVANSTLTGGGGPMREVGTHFVFAIQEIFGRTSIEKAKVEKIEWSRNINNNNDLQKQQYEQKLYGAFKVNLGIMNGIASPIKKGLTTKTRYLSINIILEVGSNSSSSQYATGKTGEILTGNGRDGKDFHRLIFYPRQLPSQVPSVRVQQGRYRVSMDFMNFRVEQELMESEGKWQTILDRNFVGVSDYGRSDCVKDLIKDVALLQAEYDEDRAMLEKGFTKIRPNKVQDPDHDYHPGPGTGPATGGPGSSTRVTVEDAYCTHCAIDALFRSWGCRKGEWLYRQKLLHIDIDSRKAFDEYTNLITIK